MERLTDKVRNYDGTATSKQSLVVEEGLRAGSPSDYCSKIVTKLADYEDAEEQGLLLKLPCAENTTVYVIKNNADACWDCKYFDKGYCGDCCEDYCSNKNVKDEDGNAYLTYPQYADNPLCKKHFFEIIEKQPSLDWIYTYKKYFGKTVFLTREEAEQALEKMKGE